MTDIKPPEEEKPVNLFYRQLEKESQISGKPNPDMYLDKFQEVAHELGNILEHSLDDEREQVLIRTSFLKDVDWLLSVGHRAYMRVDKPNNDLHEISKTLMEILREMRKRK